MQLLSFNLEGYRRNRLYLSELIADFSPKILFLQEIWLQYSDSKLMPNDFPSLNFQLSTPGMFTNTEDKIISHSQTWHGVALGWHDDIHSQVSPLKSNYERFAAARIALNSMNLLVISFYAPTSGKDDEFLECFCYLTNFLTENRRQNDVLLIGTDSNCSAKSTTRRKKILSDFCTAFSLIVHTTNNPTFHHSNLTSESCIDYFLISESQSQLLGKINQLCNLEHPMNLSSHDPLLSTLKISMEPTVENIPGHSSNYTNFNQKRIIWDKLKMNQYQSLAGKALTSALEYWNFPEAIPLLCSLFPQLLVNCAEMTFDSKISNSKPSKFKKSRKQMKAEKILKKAYRNWKAYGKPKSPDDKRRKSLWEAR